MPEAGKKRPAPLAVAAVFGAAFFIAAAALMDWSLKLTAPLWGVAEILILAAILVWRRHYLKHNA